MTAAAPSTPGRTPAVDRPTRPFRTLARLEAAQLRRTPAAVLFMALLPIAAAVVLAAVPATRRPSADLDGASYLATYLPILMMFALYQSGVVMLPGVLSRYRETGFLRRLATTPVPPARLLGVQAAIYLTVGVVVDVVLLVVGIAAGVPLPHRLPGFVLSLLLVAAALLGIGMLITALAPREQVTQVISTVLLFPLMFFAGLWLPRSQMPSALRAVSDGTPLGAGVRAIQASISGQWPAPAALLVIAGYAMAAGLLAVRLFRWDWE